MRPQHLGVERFGKTAPAVGLRLVLAPRCDQRVDIGRVPRLPPRLFPLGARALKNIKRGIVIASSRPERRHLDRNGGPRQIGG